MAKRKLPEYVLSENLPHVRVTPAEHHEIRDGAEKFGVTITDFLRILIFRRLPVFRMKKLQLVDPSVMAELCRQGGNFRSLVKEHGDALAAYDSEIKLILSKISSAVEAVAAAHEKYLTEGVIPDDR